MDVRLLEADDIASYIGHFAALNGESGADGQPMFHPYNREEAYDVEAAILGERSRWATALDGIGWRRAFGLLLPDGGVVGHLYFAGAMLLSERHRISMGMGIRLGHRGQGGGRALLDAGLKWANDQPMFDWVDIGVFSENAVAITMYEQAGFERIGVRRDAFRVDGRTIDDILMTRRV